ncbi:ORF_22 [Adoxophyes orana granulovirus]|uniref:ORF_22 n=1 Tax=Adoxophyes orana granulovirus TaxID=170617 RepID=Q7T9Z3_GVAO|nr:ORF_22 [Adoxophyes orana granulovirus]AAP85659.1 ORF_22 [Adoxophyes orana granulovirus]
MAAQIYIDDVISVISDLIDVQQDKLLCARLQDVKHKLQLRKCIKWKIETKIVKKIKLYLHIYYVIKDHEALLAFVINNRSQPKTAMKWKINKDGANDDKECFYLCLTLFLGVEDKQNYMSVLRNVKKLNYFYRYVSTRYMFRHVSIDNLVVSLNKIIEIYEHKYNVVNNYLYKLSL